MSNTFLNPSIIAKEYLRQLPNNTVMGTKVYRGYEQEFMTKVNGWKKGSSITIKTPLMSRVQDGQTINVVDYREEDVTFTVDSWKHVAHKLTGTEMTMNIEQFSERFVKPDVQAIGNHIDKTLLGLYKDIPNQVGTPGTTPNDFYTFASAQAVLADHAVTGDIACIVDPWCQAAMADSFKGLFAMDKVKDAISKGSMGGMIAGMDMYMSQNVNSHTCGTAAGLATMLVDGAASEGDTTITWDQNGSLAVVGTQGDIFTVATVNGVNPISGDSTGRLRQFVINAATSSSGNDDAVECTPGTAPYNIYSASAAKTYLPYQNVDALPADNDQIIVAGTASLVHKVNLAFHKNTFGLVMVPVEELQGLKSYRETDPDTGFTVTVTLGGDIINYVNYMRVDVLYGVKTLNPFTGCRIAG